MYVQTHNTQSMSQANDEVDLILEEAILEENEESLELLDLASEVCAGATRI